MLNNPAETNQEDGTADEHSHEASAVSVKEDSHLPAEDPITDAPPSTPASVMDDLVMSTNDDIQRSDTPTTPVPPPHEGVSDTKPVIDDSTTPTPTSTDPDPQGFSQTTTKKGKKKKSQK